MCGVRARIYINPSLSSSFFSLHENPPGPSRENFLVCFSQTPACFLARQVSAGGHVSNPVLGFPYAPLRASRNSGEMGIVEFAGLKVPGWGKTLLVMGSWERWGVQSKKKDDYAENRFSTPLPRFVFSVTSSPLVM